MVVKSQLKIGYEKTHNTLFFTYIIIKNEYTRYSWEKKIILIIIKLIFHYQVRRESYILLFEKEKKQIRNKSKNNKYI